MLIRNFEPLPGVCITVKTEDGRALFTKHIIYSKLAELTLDNNTVEFVIKFAAAYSQSAVSGDLGFDWPALSDNSDAWEAAFNAWLALPAPIIRRWFEEIAAVDAPPNERDLLPPTDESKKSEANPT